LFDFLNIYVDLFINISSNSIRITMLPSDIRSMQEAYRNVYEESDLLLDDLIEEIVEELIEECLEFGYTLDESADAVEAAAILYIDEATVTYGSDTISPEDRRTEAKSRLKDMKASKRKAAVKGAVERVKSTAKGVKAAAGIAGSIAKNEVTRAGRSATHAAGKAASAAGSAVKGAAGAVSAAASKKKAEVKQGVKGLIGRGLRKAAGAIGNVAQRAAGAASRLGEAKDNSYLETNMNKREKNNNDAINSMRKTDAHKSMAATAAKKLEEKVEIYDVVLEYLMTEGHADTIAEAEYIMTELDSEMVNQILETRLDPRGRPASGPMNVYRDPKGKPDQAHLDAIKSYDEKQKKKTPAQRDAELAAYINRQRNK
jgi:hypothetical protein